jgi:RNA polymerase sigma factor (sigma-70 family)
VTKAHESGVHRRVRTLFGLGTLNGRTDRHLLELFLSGGSSAEPAFAALVDRHGPMVLRVCRAILRNPQDVEDAFQATFLVLVRRAGSIWVRDSLGPWLYHVARRVSRHALKIATRRRTYEQRMAESTQRVDLGPRDVDDEEDSRLLNEELSGLSSRYQAPLVLCYLEGMTHEQAARQLRCPVGTVRSRLARGRDQLRKRLERRGLRSSRWVLGPITPGWPSRGAVPPRLTEATLAAAGELVRGSSTGPSSSILTLAEGVSMAMLVTKFKYLIVCSLLIVSAGVGSVSLARQTEAKAPPLTNGDFGKKAAPLTRDDFGKKADPLARDDFGKKADPLAGPETAALPSKRNFLGKVHSIPAPPGAQVRILVTTPDQQVIQCDAEVRTDGEIEIKQNAKNQANNDRVDITTSGQAILISPRVKYDATGVFGGRMTLGDLVNPGGAGIDAGDHSAERRLLNLVQKFDFLLQLLEKQSPIHQNQSANQDAPKR